jgi:hypothetical protein
MICLQNFNIGINIVKLWDFKKKTKRQILFLIEKLCWDGIKKEKCIETLTCHRLHILTWPEIEWVLDLKFQFSLSLQCKFKKTHLKLDLLILKNIHKIRHPWSKDIEIFCPLKVMKEPLLKQIKDLECKDLNFPPLKLTKTYLQVELNFFHVNFKNNLNIFHLVT